MVDASQTPDSLILYNILYMFQLCNRIAWGISLALGMLGSIAIIEYTFFSYIFGDFSLIIGAGIACMIKGIFLSEAYIKQRIRFFYDRIREDDMPASHSVHTPTESAVSSPQA